MPKFATLMTNGEHWVLRILHSVQKVPKKILEVFFSFNSLLFKGAAPTNLDQNVLKSVCRCNKHWEISRGVESTFSTFTNASTKKGDNVTTVLTLIYRSVFAERKYGRKRNMFTVIFG